MAHVLVKNCRSQRENLPAPKTIASQQHHGFTLIELLVVVAIIALLISILLPSLSRAREQGKSAVCKSNLRQITTSYLIYAQEISGTYISINTNYNVYIPAVAAYRKIFWYGDGVDAPGWLTDYYKNQDVAYCPSLRDQYNRTAKPYSTTYGYNANQPDTKVPWTNPSDSLFIMDAERIVSGGGGLSPEFPITEKPFFSTTNFISGGAIGRHTKTCNTSWADGHVTAEIVYSNLQDIVLESSGAARADTTNGFNQNMGYITQLPQTTTYATFSTSKKAGYYYWFDKDAQK